MLPVVETGRLVGVLARSDALRVLEGVTGAGSGTPVPCAGTPMPAIGDARPGRPAPRPVAMVVHPDPQARAAPRRELAAEGYRVESCPGPGAGVQCPGADRPGQDGPCVRLPDPVRLVVVDAATARTRLLESYQAWRPGVAIRVAEAADRAAASGGGW